MATVLRRVKIAELYEKAKGESIVIPVDLSAYLLASEETAGVITGITQASPGVVTSTAHGRSDGDVVRIEDVEGMVEVNGKRYTVANQAANTFELTTEETPATNVATTDYTALSGPGRWRLMQSISSCTATHIPLDAAGDALGSAATITVGTIANGVIPLTFPAQNADNAPLSTARHGTIVYHHLHIKPVLANPTETPIFVLVVGVWADGS